MSLKYGDLFVNIIIYFYRDERKVTVHSCHLAAQRERECVGSNSIFATRQPSGWSLRVLGYKGMPYTQSLPLISVCFRSEIQDYGKEQSYLTLVILCISFCDAVTLSK